MAPLEVIQFPDRRLKQMSAPVAHVDQDLRKLADEMLKNRVLNETLKKKW